MHIQEKDLENMLVTALKEAPQTLYDRGFRWFAGGTFELRQQVPTGSGIADIVLFSPNTVEVIELKKGNVGFDTLNQALRYAVNIKDTLEYKYNKTPDVCVTLVGRAVSDYISLISAIEGDDGVYVNVVTYDFDPFKGLTFDRHNYSKFSKHLYDDSIHQYCTLDSCLLDALEEEE